MREVEAKTKECLINREHTLSYKFLNFRILLNLGGGGGVDLDIKF